MFAPYRDTPKVTIFGSARVKNHDPLWEQTRKVAASLAQNGLEYSALVQVTRARIDILESAIGTR